MKMLSMKQIQKIGFIGLGKMGLPMTRNLVKSGYRVTVWNRTADKCREVKGTQIADSISGLATDQDVTISMISDDAALLHVSKQVLATPSKGSIYIDMSTVSPTASAQVATACASKGVIYLRAPVSGSVSLAESGTLTILCSGSKEAYEKVRPVFQAVGQKSFHVGEGEEARYLKLTINMMVGLSAAVTAEALALSSKAGLDLATTLEIMANSVVASPLIGYKIELLKKREFSPDFTVDQMAKDFDIMLESGRSLDLFMPLTSLVRQYLGTMRAWEMGGLDFFGLVKIWERLSAVA